MAFGHPAQRSRCFAISCDRGRQEVARGNLPGRQPERLEEAVRLGEESLLGLELAAAAEATSGAHGL